MPDDNLGRMAESTCSGRGTGTGCGAVWGPEADVIATPLGAGGEPTRTVTSSGSESSPSPATMSRNLCSPGLFGTNEKNSPCCWGAAITGPAT